MIDTTRQERAGRSKRERLAHMRKNRVRPLLGVVLAVAFISSLAATNASGVTSSVGSAGGATKVKLPRETIGIMGLPQFFNALIGAQLFEKSAKAEGWNIVATHDSDLSNLVPDVKQAVGDMIRANPDITAIWGCCDFAVAGAIPAIQQSGK